MSRLVPKRAYGNTGAQLSILGFGGIVVMNTDQSHADRVVAEAVERGVNYFDVAPAYGNAEEKLGPALEPHRKDIFLACKTGKRNKAEALEELAGSLERLRTDHFDLYQLHSLYDKDIDSVFMKGGAIEALAEARADGRVRYLGFSAHSPKAALAAMDRFQFDSVLFPTNFVTYHKSNFGPSVLAKAQEQGVARLALKAMAYQVWPEEHAERDTYRKCWYQPLTDPHYAQLALRWTLSQPVTAAVSPGEESLFRLALDVASEFTPITDAETAELRPLIEAAHPIFPDA